MCIHVCACVCAYMYVCVPVCMYVCDCVPIGVCVCVGNSSRRSEEIVKILDCAFQLLLLQIYIVSQNKFGILFHISFFNHCTLTVITCTVISPQSAKFHGD